MRTRLFDRLARLDVERPYLVLAAALILSILAVFYTRARLEFRTGQDDLISGENRASRDYLRYTHEFPDLDGAIIVVRAAPEPRRAERFVEALAARLLADKANVKSVFYRVDPGLFSDRALLYLSTRDLKTLAARIEDHREFLTDYAAAPRLATFFSLVNREANRAMTSRVMSDFLGTNPSASRDPSESGLDLGTLNAVLRGMLAPAGSGFVSPWAAMVGAGGQNGVLRDGFIATENGKYLLLHVAPGDGVKGGPDPVAAIEDDLNAVRAQFPDVEAGMTGGPALAYSEQVSTEHDIALASVLAVASNALLVIVPFRAIVEPLFALVALLVGVAWSFGFTTLAVGHLNLLSAVFTSILAGIGINFPIHMMARYDEARRRGAAMPQGVKLAVVNTGLGVVASASIMALAFVMPVFSKFKGIAELGLVSAAGLFLCLLSALFVFPALVAIRDRNRPPGAKLKSVKPETESRLGVLFRRPWIIIVVASVLSSGVFVLAPKLRFDQNLLKLQAENSEAVRFENKLLRDSGRSSWFAVSLAKTRDEAERLAARYRKLPEVSDAETIATYIPDRQAQKRSILASLKPVIDPVEVEPLTNPKDSAALANELKALKFKLDSAAAGDPSSEPAQTAELIGEALSRLKTNPHAFDTYERAMASDLAEKLAELKRNLSPGEITEANLPRVLRDRFIGASGVYLVQVYPRGDVWGDAALHRFVTALRTVDPDVTGPPVQTYAMATMMRHGYERAAALALIAVFVFVFADFRNMRDTALATVPLVFGGAWLLEAMVLLGWEFNLANLFAIPIIIGTGVDNGVNMLYRWREERNKTDLILTKAVGKSVTIASLTTIAGFAALIPATHRGISSLGWVLSVGVGFIFLATVIVLPALFKVIGSRTDASETMSGGEKPGRVASAGMKALMVGALCLAAALYPVVSRATNTHASGRAESNRLVAQAEQLVMQAGQANPVDSSKINAAIAKLHQALKIDPRNDSAYVDLGFCYSVLRDADTAVDMYRTATMINPSPGNFKELADIYLRMGEPEKALMAANAGLEKNPRDARLWNAKGLALHDLLRTSEAIAAFRNAVHYDPRLEVARQNLKALGVSVEAPSAAKNR
jgi:hopanoid biosynthesis associated RND transporter like protein HpnN